MKQTSPKNKVAAKTAAKTVAKKPVAKVAKKPAKASKVTATHAVVKTDKVDDSAKYFDGVVGQPRAKTELGFYLTNHLESGSVIPNILLTGSKGDGKTHLARKFARNLPDIMDPSRKNKAFYSFNGGAILNPTILLEDILSKVQDQPCTIFIDEAHGLPKKVQTVLLTILETNKSHRTSYTFNDIDYNFDFRRITFIFATTEEDKIFHALRDRLVTLSLEPYGKKELAEIIELTLDGQVSFDGDMLSQLSEYVRRNARNATRIAENARMFNTPIFEKKHLDILKEKLNLFPLGVTFNEIRALKILETDGECSLGHLSCRLAQASGAVQREVEPYLIANRLMEIDGKRRITALGRQYLKMIEGKDCVVPAQTGEKAI